MAIRWYNPLTWRFFGYNDPKNGEYVEVDLVVGGKATKSGVRVTPTRALTVPIVWSCVKILSESVSGLPLKLYEEGGEKGRRLVTGSDRQLRLLRRPNPYITRLNFLKGMVANMALRGNAYAIIERNRRGEWIGTLPLGVDDVEPKIDPDVGLVYEVAINGDRTLVSPENMLHFKMFTQDGIIGLSPVEYHAEAMGLSLVAQDWAARFMRKGGVSGGYVIYEQFLTKEQQADILAKFPDIRQNDSDSLGAWGILQGNPKIVPAGLSQRDAQFIETQQFQEEALTGIWGVPLWLASRASKTSIMGSNLEQQLRSFTTFGLKPYLDAVQDEINAKLFPDGERFVEFVVEGLLQADSAARAAYYQAALGGSGGTGWMSPDEVRVKENLPELGGEYSRVTRWEMSNANES